MILPEILNHLVISKFPREIGENNEDNWILAIISLDVVDSYNILYHLFFHSHSILTINNIQNKLLIFFYNLKHNFKKILKYFTVSTGSFSWSYSVNLIVNYVILIKEKSSAGLKFHLININLFKKILHLFFYTLSNDYSSFCSCKRHRFLFLKSQLQLLKNILNVKQHFWRHFMHMYVLRNPHLNLIFFSQCQVWRLRTLTLSSLQFICSIKRGLINF